MHPADDPNWAHYTNTLLELDDGAIVVDLRAPLTAETQAQLTRQIGPTFATISAFNPRGRIVADDENRRRFADLEEAVRARGARWVRGDGLSPDREHREWGVAVVLPLEDARRLACDWEQSALFWFDGTAFWLEGALVQGVSIRLPAR